MRTHLSRRTTMRTHLSRRTTMRTHLSRRTTMRTHLSRRTTMRTPCPIVPASVAPGPGGRVPPARRGAAVGVGVQWRPGPGPVVSVTRVGVGLLRRRTSALQLRPIASSRGGGAPAVHLRFPAFDQRKLPVSI